MNRRYNVSDINKQLIWNLRDIGHTIRQLAEGKGSQKRILGILFETGPITQKELTQRLGIQPGSASEVIAKLEDSGCIVRTLSETDRRTMDVQLTEQGRSIAEEFCLKRIERQREMFSGITEEEKETLLSLLEKVNADWDLKYREKGQCKIHRMWYRSK